LTFAFFYDIIYAYAEKSKHYMRPLECLVAFGNRALPFTSVHGREG